MPMSQILTALGLTKPPSRPYCSYDNPSSEAQYKTIKYRPEFPHRFGSIQDSRSFGHVFFPWYNTEHRHSGLGMLTPHEVHYGLAAPRTSARSRAAAPSRVPSRSSFLALERGPQQRREFFWDIDQRLGSLGALALATDLTLELDDLLVPRIGRHDLRPTLLRR